MYSTPTMWLVVVVVLTFFIASQCASKILDRSKMVPCKFNPLCHCSNNGEDLGAVECSGVPLADLPPQLDDTRVFALTLQKNGLRKFPVGKMRVMGSWSLEVSGNSLHSLPSLAFSGLERSLWTLILSDNSFTRVPADSLAPLQKLNYLDLSDNHISDIDQQDLKSLTRSLVTLILAGNSLTSVPEGVFWNLKQLERLDLSRNNIINIHSMAFQTGVPLLAHLNLANNLLGKIPFMAVSSLVSLKSLDFSNNRIETIQDTFSKKKMKLDKLLLRENNIKVLSKHTFKNFKWINFTSLQGNPLVKIENNAFLETRMRELDLNECQLSVIEPGAFRGLERTLENLNLGSNRLSILPGDLFHDFSHIKKLKLAENMLAVSPNVTFTSFRHSIERLDMRGEHMRYVPMQEMSIMRSLRMVGLASIRDYGNLRLSQFENFPPGLEVLNLIESSIKVIKNNAFYHIPSVAKLDLSGNQIVRIEDVAFREIGNSLQELKMSNSLHLSELPSIPFQSLRSLISLDLSDNHIRFVPLDTFHKMNKLKRLYLQDNSIESFTRGTFHSQANPNLCVLDLSFNQIQTVEYDMFRFESLTKLHLDDNQIMNIDERSFVEMRNLKVLTLEGNKIYKLKDESFQNLHNLQYLNLAHNQMIELNFDAFDYVGSLSFMTLDVSHNKIEFLASNKTSRYATNSNIRSVDLSNNIISGIQPGFFEPINSVIKILNLANNELEVISAETLGHLRKLKSLDLSQNHIHRFQKTTLQDSQGLLYLNLSSNRLTQLESSTFHRQSSLQVLDLSFNQMAALPEDLLQTTKLDIFNMAFNKLSEIPVKTLNPVQSTLRHLDLSGNRISLISDSLLNQIQQLVELNLSHNFIYQIDEKAFCCSPSLLALSLASNPLRVVSPTLFSSLSAQLETLDLSNTSLTILPSFNLPRLVRLDMALNKLTFVPSSALANMTSLRHLDLANNYLPNPPHNVWHIMPRLRFLSIAQNPIKNILNDSFLGLDHLEELDISRMMVESMEEGTFCLLPSLRSLKLSTGQSLTTNLASLLTSNPALSRLHLVLDGPTTLRHELQDTLPPTLTKIVVEVEKLPPLHPAAFKYLSGTSLQLEVIADSLVLDKDLFLNLGSVKNLSLDISSSFSRSSVVSQLQNISKVTRPPPTASLSNPGNVFRPAVPHTILLTDLKLGNKHLPCYCGSIGWIAKWLRRKRGLVCPQSEVGGVGIPCRETTRLLREARCQGGRGLLDTLHTNLNCLSYSGGPGRLGVSGLVSLVVFGVVTLGR